MNSEIYHFKVGSFECIAIMDGTHNYPYVPAWFVNAPKERLEQVLREHNLDLEQYISAYPSLVINTGQHRVLVDTGAGDMEPSTGRLIPNLKAQGITPGDIDTVILTHGHPDHIGGNTDSKGKPIFPNARFVMWKDEWDFWTSAPSLSELEVDEQIKQLLITFARNKLPPIQGQLDLIDHETTIVPGIRAVTASGHTPGHMAVAISSNDKELLCISDTVLHPIHLKQPDWYSVFDFTPEQTVTTRRRLFQQAATEKVLVHAFHFPFPGLGYVVEKGEAWQWRPVEITS
jgi:glyoxylase-like metal-dependent hydrolase (beta-lactamase superfamily II)